MTELSPLKAGRRVSSIGEVLLADTLVYIGFVLMSDRDTKLRIMRQVWVFTIPILSVHVVRAVYV